MASRLSEEPAEQKKWGSNEKFEGNADRAFNFVSPGSYFFVDNSDVDHVVEVRINPTLAMTVNSLKRVYLECSCDNIR